MTQKAKPKQKMTQKEGQKKSNKKKKTKKRIIKFTILIFIIIAIIIFALITPIFNITEIQVEGNNKISQETIISLSGLNIGENIFKNTKSSVAENIEENSYIKKAEMRRKLPGTIELTIEEREVQYQIQLINGYIYIDSQGYILENSDEKAKVPLLKGYVSREETLLNEKRLDEQDLNKLNTCLKIMEALKAIDLENSVTNINIEDDDEYILYLKKEKKYIYLGDGSNLSNKMLYVQTMLEEEKENSGTMLINGNLNNGFKPYFRKEKIKE